ncbi:hypothetical protein H6P81_019584 [Aristolochia fimbriata]|uniref:X8 domain-containing protein n=1 Tax=Aristolochia fimbriata TaxID=158543 RepID=A0AAV7DTU4_ARIFI|nr:hypothetical protein H6P81_019584 [Aristolochia fimbriata]
MLDRGRKGQGSVCADIDSTSEEERKPEEKGGERGGVHLHQPDSILLGCRSASSSLPVGASSSVARFLFSVIHLSFMAALVILVLILGMAGASSGTQWCVCRTDLSDSALQKTLDYACGAGADCKPILQSGACFQPNTVKAHCSYAANSYFQNKGQSPGSCDFSGTATVVQTDPSSGGSCTYPTSASSTTPTTGPTTGTGGTGTGGTGTGTGTTPTMGGAPGTSTSPSTTNPGSTTPNTFTPIGGGGISSGLGPTGTGITTDQNGGFLAKMDKVLVSAALLVSGVFCLWA